MLSCQPEFSHLPIWLESLTLGARLYAGQIDTVNPPYSLCLAQTVLTYGAGPMSSTASFIFVLHVRFNQCLLKSTRLNPYFFQIYVTLRSALSERTVPETARHPKFTLAMVSVHTTGEAIHPYYNVLHRCWQPHMLFFVSL
jgi:hypothetical protein